MGGSHSLYEAVIQNLIPEIRSLVQQVEELTKKVPEVINSSIEQLHQDVSHSIRSARNLHDELDEVITLLNHNVSSFSAQIIEAQTASKQALVAEAQTQTELSVEKVRTQSAFIVAELGEQLIDRRVKPAFIDMQKRTMEAIDRLNTVTQEIEQQRNKDEWSKFQIGLIAFGAFILSSMIGAGFARFWG